MFEEKYKTTMQVAEHYGISRQAVHEWRKIGAPHHKLGPQTIMYDMYALHQWLIQNRGERKNRGVIK